MNDICAAIIEDEKMSKEFVLYVGHADDCGYSLPDSIWALKQSVSQIKREEADLESKIQDITQVAKSKAKLRDKKGALTELKKRKPLQIQLCVLSDKRETFEEQIASVDVSIYEPLDWGVDDIDEEELMRELEELEELDNIDLMPDHDYTHQNDPVQMTTNDDVNDHYLADLNISSTLKEWVYNGS